MRRGKFLFNALSCLALLAVFNVASHIWLESERHEFVNRWSWAANRLRLTQPIDILFLGDSTTVEGYRAPEFETRWKELSGEPVRTINAALNASSALEHYLILRNALMLNPNIKCVVYGVFGFRLTDPIIARRLGNAVGEVPDSVLESALDTGSRRASSLASSIARWCPMYTDRRSFWITVERSRRKLARIGMPEHPPLRFERFTDPAEAGIPQEAEFLNHCLDFVSGRIGFTQPVEGMIRLCAERNVQIVIVFMPTPGARRERFLEAPPWTDYYGHVQSELAARDVTVIDASAFLSAPDRQIYADPLHLNEEGAQLYSRLIADELYALPSVRALFDDSTGE